MRIYLEVRGVRGDFLGASAAVAPPRSSAGAAPPSGCLLLATVSAVAFGTALQVTTPAPHKTPPS
eukprot:6288608-Pyramimonas_sp.AAC.1